MVFICDTITFVLLASFCHLGVRVVEPSNRSNTVRGSGMMLSSLLRLGFWSSTKALTNREAIDVSDSDGYHVDATAKWKVINNLSIFPI